MHAKTRILLLSFLLTCFTATPVYANCSSPVGKTADIIYNSASHTYQFCNGTTWIKYSSGVAWKEQSTNNPSYPAGSGFFVLSKNTFTGNLGNFSGADATCLTELTTNTGWKGYSTANGNGQLIGAKVHAFLCDGTCTSMNASATYYFANAGNSAAGGASFTLNGSGVGPNDTANWAAANYFGGAYTVWTGRGDNFGGNQPTTWATSGENYPACSTWTDGTSGSNGVRGMTANINQSRWGAIDATLTCDHTFYIICFVNP